MSEQRKSRNGFSVRLSSEETAVVLFQSNELKRSTNIRIFKLLTTYDFNLGRAITTEQTLVSTKVTCHPDDTYSIEKGREEAFTKAMDIWTHTSLRDIEKSYAHWVKKLEYDENMLLTRFKAYVRNGR